MKERPSPEKLNDYIRIGSMGGYLLIAVLVIGAAALVVWGVFGRIPVTAAKSGVVMEREHESHTCLSFIDAHEGVGALSEGDAVTVTMIDGSTFSGTVSSVQDTAMSAEEVRHTFSVSEMSARSTVPDWITHSILSDSKVSSGLTDWMMNRLLGDSKYIYAFTVETEEDISAYWHQMAGLTVILSEVQPISYLLG